MTTKTLKKPQKDDTRKLALSLSDRVDSLVPALFPDKPFYRHSNEIRVNNKGSLCITLGSEGLVYFCHETQEGGDVYRLIQHALRCNFTSALAWAKSFLGVTEGKILPEAKPRPAANQRVNKKQKIDDALRIISESLPATDTYAEVYLRNRGITIKLPDCIRFHPGVWNFTTRRQHPSLVVPVQNMNGEITGIHFVCIDPSTGKKIQQEGIQPKLSKGVIKGSAVRLSADDTAVVLTEGIEDALSILQIKPGLCVWAGLGGNIRSVQFPDEVEKVIIGADHDNAGQRNVEALKKRLTEEGRQVKVAYPPVGFKDFNDYLQGSVA